MSYLGQAMTRLMEENSLTQKMLARKTGMQQSTISRLKCGAQTFISKEELGLLAGAIGKNKLQCAEVIAAHLRDECAGPGADLIAVTIQSTPRPLDPIEFKVRLSRQTETALNFLARTIVTSPSAEQAVLSLAAVLGFQKK